jgi:hypothetical protein
MIKIDENNSFYSPYECSSVVNGWLEELGVEKKVAPQMFYNYVKKGYIVSDVIEGKSYVNGTELQTWFTKYYNKNVLGKKESVILNAPANPISE